MTTIASTVLVVEDEFLLRLDAVELLEDAGYTVLEATTADEALEMFRTRDDIDLVFSDVNMPGRLDGMELVRLVNSIRPDVGIVVASGMTRPQPGQLPEGAASMTKPYHPDALLTALAERGGATASSIHMAMPRMARG